MENRYISISKIEQINFSGCEGCLSSCCDGSRFLFSPLILNDFEEVYQFFPIVFANINEEWRALILLAGEKGSCRYYERQCQIYDNRPPGCRLYPLNPYFEDILIDTSCCALTYTAGTFLASKKEINTGFYHQRIDNFEHKRTLSVRYLKELNEDFELLGEIGGLLCYYYSGEYDDPYLQMHRSSLQLLPDIVNKVD